MAVPTLAEGGTGYREYADFTQVHVEITANELFTVKTGGNIGRITCNISPRVVCVLLAMVLSLPPDVAAFGASSLNVASTSKALIDVTDPQVLVTLLSKRVPDSSSAMFRKLFSDVEEQKAFECNQCMAIIWDAVCAIKSNGTMGCWGRDIYPEVDPDPSHYTPRPANFSSDIMMVSGNSFHFCAVSKALELQCWGLNLRNQSQVPEAAKSNTTFVSAGDSHSCAISILDELRCWGQYNADVLNSSSIPEDFQENVMYVSSGGHSTCAINVDRDMACWGANDKNQTDIPEGWTSGIDTVACGYAHCCANKLNGSLICWGDASQNATAVPEDLTGNVTEIVVGVVNTCAKDGSGVWTCWGRPDVEVDQGDTFETAVVYVDTQNFAGHCVITADAKVNCTGLDEFANVPPDFEYLNSDYQFPTAAASSDSQGGGLSTAAIVGIAVGSAVAVLLVLIALLLLFVHYRKRCSLKAAPKHTPAREHGRVKAAAAVGLPLRAGPPLESIYATDLMSFSIPTQDGLTAVAEHQRPPVQKSDGSGTSSTDNPRTSSCSSGPSSHVIDADELHIAVDASGQNIMLGQGGFSKVYKGYWKDRQVAIKSVEHTTEGETQIKALLREICMLRQCVNDNIVRFLGASFAANNVLLVFEFMDKGDLFKALRSVDGDQYLWMNRGKEIARDIARGLSYMHGVRIIHCDLKSLNVMLAADGTAKIGDMGMSKFLLKEYVTKGREVGTYNWAAPELLMDSQISEKVDIYSFGVILWELVTGEPPQRGQMRAIRVPEECPQDVLDLIMACQRVEAEERPTVQDVLDKLNALF